MSCSVLLVTALATSLPVVSPAPAADATAATPPETEPREATRPKKTTENSLDPERLEFGVLPALSYDSNSGLGVGALVNLVKFETDANPYLWQVEVLGSATLHITQDGSVETPFHQDYIKLDLPNLWQDRLRLSARLAFERDSDAAYYGPGNASTMERERKKANRRAYQVDRLGPSLRLAGRLRLVTTEATRLEAFVAPIVEWNWVNPYPNSVFLDDLADPQRTLHGTTTHGLVLISTGVLWDGRDHESAPTRGFLSQLTLRGGFGLAEDFAFAGVTAEQRFFLPIWAPYFVIAGRVVADLLFGEAPFYELPRGGGLTPLNMGGGARSIRGVDKDRYAGHIKLLANLEVRNVFYAFTLFNQRFKLGVVAFCDSGRVFADYHRRPDLDGRAVAIKVGTGGGARIHWGEHFIIRFDVAHSPSEGTQGLYIGVRHIF